jgi:transcriptional regulator GlxA family with amidase domain
VAEQSDYPMTPAHPARHLLRAKDLVDARYREPLDVPALARAALLSTAHFSREFRRGVEFTDEPTERPCGVDAGFRDPSGNQARIVQAA